MLGSANDRSTRPDVTAKKGKSRGRNRNRLDDSQQQPSAQCDQSLESSKRRELVEAVRRRGGSPESWRGLLGVATEEGDSSTGGDVSDRQERRELVGRKERDEVCWLLPLCSTEGAVWVEGARHVKSAAMSIGSS